MLDVRRLDRAGAVAGPARRISPSASGSHLIADARGRSALATWSPFRAGGPNRLRAQRLTLGGRPVGARAASTVIAGDGGFTPFAAPGLATWLLVGAEDVSTSSSRILLHRARPGGTLSPAPRRVSGADERAPYAPEGAAFRDAVLVAWNGRPSTADESSYAAYRVLDRR